MTLGDIPRERGAPLAPLTTYRVGGPADLTISPRTVEELQRTVRACREAGVLFHVLGRGSNVLIGDKGIRGAVLLLRALDWVRQDGETLVCGAGADCTGAAAVALWAGLTGLEFFHYLPGSVGGAAFMNARAFEQEVSQVWTHALLVTAEGELRETDLCPGDFRYKFSPLQASGELAAELTLKLAPGDREAIAARMAANEEKRRSNGELDFPSCGCVFKNDRRIGAPSGRLIDASGLKGFAMGGAQVSLSHANFVVNRGGATAAEIRAVIEHVRAEVQRRTGFLLELEVRFLGEF
jgi:UDP-N-acetylmuramate dehydrogenase